MSAILSADDLNDFISPGVACIKPIEIQPALEDELAMEIEINIDGQPLEVSKEGAARPLEPAQISLSDCLACSGCITSAEEVLVLQHSHKELLSALESGKYGTFVASVSHQTRASIAGAYAMTLEQSDRFLIDLFVERLGFSHIVGLGLGRKVALALGAGDVLRRKTSGALQGPVLTGACPGFVLYAEKTHPELLARLSGVKSPQQVTGYLLKRLVGSGIAGAPQNVSHQPHNSPHSQPLTPQTSGAVYHLALMPCFDKKLELARPEDNGDTSADVDCVITLKELVQLMADRNLDVLLMVLRLKTPNLQPLESLYRLVSPPNWPFPVESWASDEGSSSGGYALQYLLHFRRHLVETGVLDDAELQIVQVAGRNSDIFELRLVHVVSGDKVASAAVVNGFRNIQNVVRKLKTGSGKKTRSLVSRRKAHGADAGAKTAAADVLDLASCDYVEIMACPSGCINGGGQVAPPQDVSLKEWVQNVEKLYFSIPIAPIPDLELWLAHFCSYYDVEETRILRAKYQDAHQQPDNVPKALLIGSKW